MTAIRIVPTFDEIKDLQGCVALVAKFATIDQFAFKSRKEAFTHGVVIAIANRSHRGPDAFFSATLAKSDRSVLGFTDRSDDSFL